MLTKQHSYILPAETRHYEIWKRLCAFEFLLCRHTEIGLALLIGSLCFNLDLGALRRHHELLAVLGLTVAACCSEWTCTGAAHRREGIRAL